MVKRKQKITYLAGPIGIIPQKGAAEWRLEMEEKLYEIGIKTSNPMGNEEKLNRPQLKQWVDDGKIGSIRKMVRTKLIGVDLRMVANCDFLTLYIPLDNGYEICGCVDEETEIFTLNGFKKYKDIIKNEEIVSLNMEKQTLERDNINEVFTQFYNGKMLSIEKRDISMRVTPNHRCVIESPPSKIIIKPAEQLCNYDKILQSSKYHNIFSTLTKADGRIIGLIITDGWIEPYRVSICQKEGIKSEIIEKWLFDSKVDFHKRTRQISELKGHYGGNGVLCCYDFRSESNQYFKSIISSKNESLFYLLNNSQDFLEGVWEGMMLGDGAKRKYGESIGQKGDIKTDFIQAIAILLGKRCKKSINKTFTVGEKKYYYTYITNHKSVLIKTKGKKDWIDYKGIIWCPQTNNGTWVARRNGTIFITGNSYGEITLAHYLHKPVLIVTDRKLLPIQIPLWSVGCSDFIFRTWAEYLSYVKEHFT